MSKALGLKIKQDLQSRGSQDKHQFVAPPPPLPPGLPGKHIAHFHQGKAQSLNGDSSPVHYAPYHQPRPQSVLTVGTKGISQTEETEDPLKSTKSEDSSEPSKEVKEAPPPRPEAPKPTESNGGAAGTSVKKHRRTTSIGGSGEAVAHQTVHTPV